jgi:arylsulfatase A
MSHVHSPIMRTPDSSPDSKDLYSDNIAYMDKLVGKLVSELERLHLREKTVLVFVGDNGTAPGQARRATIGGRDLSGMKGTLLEGGSRVPMIVNQPGTTPSGKVNDALVDFSDFFPTFAALAGAKLPEGVTIDGHSFDGQIRKGSGTAREWAYVELNGKWYVRSARYKLNSAGELFDMKDAPFVEARVPADTKDPEALAARTQLQAALDKLNPAAGKQSGVPERVTNKLQKRDPTSTASIEKKANPAERKNKKAARREKRRAKQAP